MFNVCEVLQKAKDRGALEVHLKAGMPPKYRCLNQMDEFSDPGLTSDDITECLLKITTVQQRNILEEQGEYCFSYDVPSVGRYRVNVFKSRGLVSMVFHEILPVSELASMLSGCEEQIAHLAGKKEGLVLFSGNAGSGRTSVMAAVVHEINQTGAVHIMTMEHPVEVVQTVGKSIVNQRELDLDYTDSCKAIANVRKEKVDVLVYDGELDGDLVRELLKTSKAGILVMASAYGNDLPEVISNITEYFPTERKDEIRKNISELLQAVVICKITEDACGPKQEMELISVDSHIRNQIRNKI